MDTEDTIWVPVFWFKKSIEPYYENFTEKEILVRFSHQYPKVKEEIDFVLENGVDFEIRVEEVKTLKSGKFEGAYIYVLFRNVSAVEHKMRFR